MGFFSPAANHGGGARRKNSRSQLILSLQVGPNVYLDMGLLGQIACVGYGAAPVLIQIWSLATKGPRFDFRVGSKPLVPLGQQAASESHTTAEEADETKPDSSSRAPTH